MITSRLHHKYPIIMSRGMTSRCITSHVTVSTGGAIVARVIAYVVRPPEPYHRGDHVFYSVVGGHSVGVAHARVHVGVT